MNRIETNNYAENNKSADLYALIFIILFFAIDFLPNFNISGIQYPQFLEFSILNIIMSVYFYLKPEFIAVDTFDFLKNNSLLRIYLIFILFCGLSFFGAKNASLVISNLIDLTIIFCLIVNFSILLKNKLYLIYKIILIVGLVAILKSGYEIYKFKQIADHFSTGEALSKMFGNTGNINILAATLNLKVPFLLIGITTFSGNKKLFLFVSLLLVTIVILLTGARAAIISLFLVYFIFILYYINTSLPYRQKIVTCAILIFPVLISIYIADITFKHSENRQRYSSIENRIGQIKGGDQSANLRLQFWRNAIKMTQANPILGVGLGNYIVESIPYERDKNSDATISTHTHNDFLEIFAETGVINGLIYFFLFVFLFFLNFRNVIKPFNDNSRIVAILTLMMVISYGVDSFFNFPMFKGTMVISFCLLVVFTILNKPQQSKLEFSTGKNNIYLLCALIGIIPAYFAILGCKAGYLETELILDKDGDKIKGKLTGDYIASQLPVCPNILSTSQSYYEFAARYYTHEKKYDMALKYLSKAEKINPYLGGIAMEKYLISIEKKNTDSAYVYIKESLKLRPKNLKAYQYAQHLATLKHDTLEILRQHQLITSHVRSPEAWNIAAHSLQILCYDEKKLTDFLNKAVKEFPDNSILRQRRIAILSAIYIKRGEVFQDQKKYKKALENYQEVLKIDPDNENALKRIGGIYFNLGRYEKAIAFFSQVLTYENPKNNSGRIEFFLGLSYDRKNDKEKACQYFNLSKAKNYPEAQALLDRNCK
ncbi:O-antigen ligase family protein [Flavobacterium humidisoli]|uniref:O-antigen ligase family protein n=1 Tax=Flavobacterium humidisoli TaxID=2937442 RepID=A0ABY4M078_9FLAO|nr:O-antigen ligase family protein [Flavobacterium humidisoli]UPZ17864.1 O-antigen ligase family protein [Flavobacterium humidisoli]